MRVFQIFSPPLSCAVALEQRHRKGFKKLNLPADQRKALLRGLTTQVKRSMPSVAAQVAHGSFEVPREQCQERCLFSLICHVYVYDWEVLGVAMRSRSIASLCERLSQVINLRSTALPSRISVPWKGLAEISRLSGSFDRVHVYVLERIAFE